MNDISILSTNVNSYNKQQHKRERSVNFSDIFNQKTKEKVSEPNQEPAKFREKVLYFFLNECRIAA